MVFWNKQKDDVTNPVSQKLQAKLGEVGAAGGSIGGFLANGFLSSITGGMGGSLGASFAASKLKTDEVLDSVVIKLTQENAIKKVTDTLATMGELMDASSYSNFPVIAACVGSGAGNLNPAVICVEFVTEGTSNTKLHISAYAKEGLIKQKTASKAIERFKTNVLK